MKTFLAISTLGLAIGLLGSCTEPGEQPLGENAGLRATPHSTVAGGAAALESGDYARFPALVGLALTLKQPETRSTPGGTTVVREEDFAKVREILRAAKDASPRFADGGTMAVYALPGHGLPRDELHMIRIRNRWFFIVD